MSNDEMKDIIKIVKSFEDSRLLPEGVSEIIQSEAKKQRGGFLSMLLGTLCASLLRNILICKGAIAKRQGRGINRAGEGIVRAGYWNKKSQKTRKKDKILKTKWTFDATSFFN